MGDRNFGIICGLLKQIMLDLEITDLYKTWKGDKILLYATDPSRCSHVGHIDFYQKWNRTLVIIIWSGQADQGIGNIGTCTCEMLSLHN